MKTKIILKSILIYGMTTMAFSCSVLFLVPCLKGFDIPQVYAYLFSAGFCLACLFCLSLILVRTESKMLSPKIVFERLRLSKMSRNDVLAVIIGVFAILILDGLIFGINHLINQYPGWALNLSSLPDFTGIGSTIKGDYGVIFVYMFYLFFNIFGEELLWRGYLLPYQEMAFGKYAWLFNGAFWLIFHAVFGISIIMMLPLLFILPFLVQRQKNTWVGIIIHATTGLIGFVSIINGVL